MVAASPPVSASQHMLLPCYKCIDTMYFEYFIFSLEHRIDVDYDREVPDLIMQWKTYLSLTVYIRAKDEFNITLLIILAYLIVQMKCAVQNKNTHIFQYMFFL